MAFQHEEHPLSGAYAALLAHGLDGAGEALRILVNEASKIERAQHLTHTHLSGLKIVQVMPMALNLKRY